MLFRVLDRRSYLGAEQFIETGDLEVAALAAVLKAEQWFAEIEFTRSHVVGFAEKAFAPRSGHRGGLLVLCTFLTLWHCAAACHFEVPSGCCAEVLKKLLHPRLGRAHSDVRIKEYPAPRRANVGGKRYQSQALISNFQV